MKIHLRKILELYDLRKLALFVRILIDIPVVQFLLIWMKVSRLLEWLDPPARRRIPFKKRDIERAQLGWKYVNFFLIHCFKVKNPCLLRSLILFHLLRKQGLDAKIHFGIKDDVALSEGHSWLSLDGNPLLERTDPRSVYTDVYSYPHEAGILRPSRSNN